MKMSLGDLKEHGPSEGFRGGQWAGFEFVMDLLVPPPASPAPLKKHVGPSVPQSVTLFGDMVFTEVIKLK